MFHNTYHWFLNLGFKHQFLSNNSSVTKDNNDKTLLNWGRESKKSRSDLRKGLPLQLRFLTQQLWLLALFTNKLSKATRERREKESKLPRERANRSEGLSRARPPRLPGPSGTSTHLPPSPLWPGESFQCDLLRDHSSWGLNSDWCLISLSSVVRCS